MILSHKWAGRIRASFAGSLAIAPLLMGLVGNVAVSAAEPVGEEKYSREQVAFFESKIRPLLISECYGCHSQEAGNVRGGLRLDSRAFTLLGGSSGPAVVPGDLDESLLWNAINHEDFVMPPKKKLGAEQIELFRRWIEMGAPDPRGSDVKAIESAITEQAILDAKETQWAYREPNKSAPPRVANADWPSTDIDRFVLAKLEDAGLPAARNAGAAVVLRRLCFDLIGLPPTPGQIASFETMYDADPQRAIEVVVDKLLDSDLFGQRWGRHWLDVARYAESTGSQVNMTFPHAWRYRDFVIDSFNDDKPFDVFVQQQIAGDLMPTDSDQQWTENLIATTFMAIGPKNLNEQNRVQFAADVIDEQIDATSRVFLGMSVACARCHDHKFDPIAQSDYYAMAGVFRNATTYFGNPPSEFGSFNAVQARQSSSLLLLPVEDAKPIGQSYSSAEVARMKNELRSLLDQQRQSRPGNNQAAGAQAARIRMSNQIADLSAKLAVVDEQGKPRSYCMGMQDRDSPVNARLLVRGEINLAGPEIPRGFPRVLQSSPIEIPDDQSGRLQMAKWIGSDDNPLTARVMVNRIWQHLFGQGIVTSTENFGSTGTPPSHPELLDYLAVTFAESGWSVKAMIREMTRSRVYRIAGDHDKVSFENDPENTLLWRANSRRLDAEAIRDAMLMASGQIDLDPVRGSEVAQAGFVRVRAGTLKDPREMVREAIAEMAASRRESFRSRFSNARSSGGRFASPGATQPDRDQIIASIYDRIGSALDMNDATFRSVYLPVVRDELPRSLEVFDFADPNSVIGTREKSNTPNQSLFLLNNRFVIEQSEAMARRLAAEHESTRDQIEAAFVLALGRLPSVGERKATASFMRSFAAGEPASSGRTFVSRQASTTELETLAAVCQGLFASAEFRYLD